MYVCDADGNMMREAISQGGLIVAGKLGNVMEYGPGNRLVKYNRQDVLYDADGNMIYGPLSGAFSAFAYDELNRLVRAGNTGYTYDGEGNRVTQTDRGNKTVYVTDPNAELSRLLMSINPDGSHTIYVYGLGLISQERISKDTISRTDGYRIFHYDYRGSTVAVTSMSGTVTDTVAYDPYGSITNRTGSTELNFLYVGRYGVETDSNGLYYMRARYYNPVINRFINEDPHWNTNNMIYGDNNSSVPDINTIRQTCNLYAYCMNNPISCVDSTGFVSAAIATQRIKDNTSYIIDAGKEFGVNPAILAAIIYAEQVKNVNYTEELEDFAQAFLGMDCSVGISQVRISTAKKVEDAGYISMTYEEVKTTYLFKNIFTGKAVYATDVTSREDKIYNKLINNQTSIRYAAAYLAMIQDIWKDIYSEIDGRTAILATLYNIGEYGTSGVNANPSSNAFGDFAKESYYKMRELLGLD